jgi:glycosyltransferase involved in cell wall biosynthesis
MILISVIIPVYNSEHYISACVESLLAQSLSSCEFIFVNDGSTDGSKSILESYKKIDSRIVLFHQENKGVSAARNAGIKIAKGDYVGFVDADDTITPDYFEQLFHNAITFEADVVFTSLTLEQEGVWTTINFPFVENQILDRDYIQKNILPYMISEDGLNSVCTKLIKREIISHNTLLFPIGMALGEDGFFSRQVISYANNVMYVPFCGYRYRAVTGSATRNLLQKDYFSKDLEIYHLDYKSELQITLSDGEINSLKNIRLLDKVYSNVMIYFRTNNGLNFLKKYQYVRKMLYHNELQVLWKSSAAMDFSNRGVFQKIMLICMQYKLLIPIFILVKYSNFRNRYIL